MSPSSEKSEMVWGEINITPGQRGSLRVGPLTLHLERTEHELRVAREVNADALADVSLSFALTDSGPPPTERIAVGPDASIRVSPQLADRPIVSRPETPLVIPSGAEITCYVATPLWMVLLIDQRAVLDFPIFPPSETWFGLPTAGVIAYASRTLLRTNRDQLPTRPHRAVSRIRIRNESESFKIERLLFPCPQLSVFSANGHIWTPDLEFVRRDATDYAAITAGSKPTDVDNVIQLNSPRKPGRLEALRVFGTWISSMGSKL